MFESSFSHEAAHVILKALFKLDGSRLIYNFPATCQSFVLMFYVTHALKLLCRERDTDSSYWWCFNKQSRTTGKHTLIYYSDWFVVWAASSENVPAHFEIILFKALAGPLLTIIHSVVANDSISGQ